MCQQDGRPVVQVGGIIGKAMNNAVDRGQHRCSCFGKQIQANVDRPPLRPIVCWDLEQV
jgi:hypothetical protein